ncbi:MAG: GAF domain-containing protein [Bacilli bacterium]|nr:GAF domain-containing protein [Bacilli bacterium]
MNIIFEQIKSIIDPSLPLVSNLANIASILFKLEDVNWAGFYLSDGHKLFLGPFQGEPACTIIPFDKGVCGYAYTKKETVVVDNVHEFKGHIACSSLSKSEIVAPVTINGEVKLVIDIDSPIYNRFKNEDIILVNKVRDLIATLF